MNERIKLLAEQAGDYVNEVYTPPVRSKTPGKIWEDGHVDWHTQFNEKFAELIVRECMLINRQRLFADCEGDTHRVAHNNALWCSLSDMQEHFGVDL
jgi:hypothetical protein